MRGVVGALVGSVIGGALGAALWAAVAYFTNYEVGFIAWAIGAMAGAGAFVGSGRQGGAACGGIAVLVALAGIAGGKYAAIELNVSDVTVKFEKDLEAEIAKRHNDVPIWIAYVADRVVEEREADGKKVEWPGGAAPEDPQGESDYPKDVWKDATARWDAMSETDQEAFKHGTEESFRAHAKQLMRAEAGSAANQAFFSSFGLFDLLWVFLAVASAFRIGSAGNEQS